MAIAALTDVQGLMTTWDARTAGVTFNATTGNITSMGSVAAPAGVNSSAAGATASLVNNPKWVPDPTYPSMLCMGKYDLAGGGGGTYGGVEAILPTNIKCVTYTAITGTLIVGDTLTQATTASTYVILAIDATNKKMYLNRTIAGTGTDGTELVKDVSNKFTPQSIGYSHSNFFFAVVHEDHSMAGDYADAFGTLMATVSGGTQAFLARTWAENSTHINEASLRRVGSVYGQDSGSNATSVTRSGCHKRVSVMWSDGNGLVFCASESIASKSASFNRTFAAVPTDDRVAVGVLSASQPSLNPYIGNIFAFHAWFGGTYTDTTATDVLAFLNASHGITVKTKVAVYEGDSISYPSSTYAENIASGAAAVNTTSTDNPLIVGATTVNVASATGITASANLHLSAGKLAAERVKVGAGYTTGTAIPISATIKAHPQNDMVCDVHGWNNPALSYQRLSKILGDGTEYIRCNRGDPGSQSAQLCTINTTISGAVSIGDSSFVVASATGIVAGMTLTVSGGLSNWEPVVVGPGYTSGTTIPIVGAFTKTHSSGDTCLGCAHGGVANLTNSSTAFMLRAATSGVYFFQRGTNDIQAAAKTSTQCIGYIQAVISCLKAYAAANGLTVKWLAEEVLQRGDTANNSIILDYNTKLRALVGTLLDGVVKHTDCPLQNNFISAATDSNGVSLKGVGFDAGQVHPRGGLQANRAFALDDAVATVLGISVPYTISKPTLTLAYNGSNVVLTWTAPTMTGAPQIPVSATFDHDTATNRDMGWYPKYRLYKNGAFLVDLYPTQMDLHTGEVTHRLTYTDSAAPAGAYYEIEVLSGASAASSGRSRTTFPGSAGGGGRVRRVSRV